MTNSRLPLEQHQAEIEQNLRRWNSKPLLQKIYAGFYDRIIALIDWRVSGTIVEVGAGIGNLKSRLPQALATDLFPNPWLDLVCDAYELPFADRSVSHLVLFDVFHHLEAPIAFLKVARRVLASGGRLILFEPFISLCSFPVYGLFHHEPVAMRETINLTQTFPQPRNYYAAQGNATRLFFRKEVPDWPSGWDVFHAEPFSCFHYLLSGGFSKPALYPARWLDAFRKLDAKLSPWPRVFGGRCLIGMQTG
jgi:SAM-dependent methyltransferase